jgi:hypothetical protein
MGIEIQMSGKQRQAENRQTRRYRYRGQATVRRLESDPSLPATILDLSAQGCLLRLPDLADFAVGTLIDMSINSDTVAFRALGSVRHCARRRRLLGISFVNLSRRGTSDLVELIAGLQSDEQAGQSRVHEITIFGPPSPPRIRSNASDK